MDLVQDVLRFGVYLPAYVFLDEMLDTIIGLWTQDTFTPIVLRREQER
jgi:hypothetical protein